MDGFPNLDSAKAARGNQARGNRDKGAPDLKFSTLEAIEPALIPPRPWAYGKFLLFGTAAVIGAVDGSGKGAIAIAMLIAVITGIPVLGEKVWRSGPVCIVTYEDDEEEWRRRICAACMHFRDKGVDYAKVMANVHFIRKPDGKVTFAMRGTKGGTLFPDSQAIVDGMKAIGAVLLIVDPFNSAHALDDGNNNVLIAQVAYELSSIAQRTQAAVLVLHHLRKGSNGDLDDLMGATGLRANFRNCRIFQRMTSDQAKELGIPDDQRWRYLRIASVKANYAPPPEDCVWYQLASVPLGNGNDLYVDGDEIGVAAPWSPPKPFDGMNPSLMRRIFEKLRGEPEPGWHYSLGANSKFWAGSVIVDIACRTEGQAKAILATWRENGVFTEEDYKTPNRHNGKRIVLNEPLVSQMTKGSHSPDDL